MPLSAPTNQNRDHLLEVFGAVRDKPKFALRPLWEFGLLPSLDALVGAGGQCEGAVVVHQEDNAGNTLTTLSCNLIF